MKRFSRRFIKKLKDSSDELSQQIAETNVNLVLKRDFVKKAKEYNKAVIEMYPIFLDNYVKCCKYLYYDFNMKSYTNDGEKTELEDECDLKIETEKIVKEYPNRRTKFIDKYNYNKMVKRWWIISTILEHYPKVLELLEQSAGVAVYKEIELETERSLIEKYSYLIEDFSLMAK